MNFLSTENSPFAIIVPHKFLGFSWLHNVYCCSEVSKELCIAFISFVIIKTNDCYTVVRQTRHILFNISLPFGFAGSADLSIDLSKANDFMMLKNSGILIIEPQ